MGENDAGYETPEEAALAGWSPALGIHIVSMDIRGDRAEVRLDMEPTYEYWTYCVRVEGRWHETVSGNAPTYGLGRSERDRLDLVTVGTAPERLCPQAVVATPA